MKRLAALIFPTALMLILGCKGAAPPRAPQPEPTPATSPATLPFDQHDTVLLRRTGGIAGGSSQLAITLSTGEAKIQDTRRSPAASTSVQIPEEDLGRLREVLAEARNLAGDYPVQAADVYYYALEYGGRSIGWSDVSEGLPRSLRRLTVMVEQLLRGVPTTPPAAAE